ncbi:MAG: cell division protein FtsZ [Bacteroidetes bacterium]|nr:cell division protein FtsZ [Bacteroidota bacterium]MDA0874489.1 cell division protein FtsZ [Bacteroidota bacterium]
MDNNLFSSHFAFDDAENEEAKICVVGVGGGGGNAVNNMISKGITGVEFYAINTDSQALDANLAPYKIQAGRGLTKGLGAGARPGVGAEAIEESRHELEEAMRGFDMVFITAGMGGGTGTGGAPIVAAIAKDLGILSVAIVTKPFLCEGPRRSKSAEAGIDLLKQNVDTLIVIPNERLLDIAGDDTSMLEAFGKADDVLYNATRGISDLITVHGLINLDFADVKTTMRSGGTALMGAATASGENRAERAAREALSSPLLDGLTINGARNVLVNITAGPSLGIREATKATAIIQEEAGDDVEVIFGTVIDERMADDLRITVIATGFEKAKTQAVPKPREVKLDVTPRYTQTAIPYKGEEGLRELDTPAYERRGSRLGLGGDGGAEPDPAERPTRVRRLNVEEISRKDEEGSSREAEVPAFLRKMMD